MKNYDFQILSPYEFEILSRDLLQYHLGIHLESFGEGADQGIDLRCSKDKLLIIQAKRYKSFSTLFSNLKKEVEKVKKLNPERYILTTNVSLSPYHKQKIKDFFTPFILNNEDIFGKEDINNLLTKFPSVEKNFHKLWLSSIEVLNEILNSQVINQTKFFLDEIREKIKIYVQNESYQEALLILKSNKYLIISGPPGIGKTTLAEMLVFNLLSQPNNEFVFLSDSIDDGYRLFDENKEQLFLFDDFLGRNFLQNSLATNEEKKIVRFINKVQKSTNKFLIFTTREYILNQAKQRFDVFEQDWTKCVLDVSKYSTIVKAQILYNHLSVNEIPFEFIDEIMKQDYLFKIITHRNYNPRIIESFSNSKFWNEFKPSEFPKALIKLFDSPFLIWKHVYENQISSISRIVLDCLLISGTDVPYNQLFKQVKVYQATNTLAFNVSINAHNFKASLRELENSMIQINKKYDGSLYVKYQNPSIQDFLVSYLNDDIITKKYLLQSILYLKPAFQIITTERNSRLKLVLDSKEIEELEKLVISKFDSLEIDSSIPTYSLPTNEDKVAIKLSLIKDFFKSNSTDFIEFLKLNFKLICYSENITNKSISEFSSLLCFFNEVEDLDLAKILLNISECFWNYDDLFALSEIENHFPHKFEQFRDSYESTYIDIFSGIVTDLSISNTTDIDTLNSNMEYLRSIEINFDFDTSEEIRNIEKKLEELEEEQSNYHDKYDEFMAAHYSRRVNNYDGSLNSYISEQELKEKGPGIGVNKPMNETETISNLFKSLK